MESLILCIGSTEWRGINHRPQHVLRGLAARGWRILYVNAPVTWLSPLKNRSLLSKWDEQWRSFEAEPGIRVLEPPVVAPFGSMWRGANVWNQHRIARAVRVELERLGVDSFVLYTLLPGSADLLPLLPGRFRVLYDCVDDHAAFTGLISRGFVRENESRLARQSDIVLATSAKLAERLRADHPSPHLVPNGVHVGHFAPTPESLERAGRWRESFGAETVLGFVGGLGDWIDLPLVAELARLRPQYTVALIGPALGSVDAVLGLPNVRLLGTVPYPDLPPIVQSFDVGLSPFVLNELTESVNPVKVYEYLAAGIEVVATPLQELRPFADALHFGRTAEEFAARIDAILEGSAGTPAELRSAIAQENSWSSRIEEIDRLLRALD